MVSSQENPSISEKSKEVFISLREKVKSYPNEHMSQSVKDETVRYLAQATQLLSDASSKGSLDSEVVTKFNRNPAVYLSIIGSFLEMQKESGRSAVLGDDFNLYITDVENYSKQYFNDLESTSENDGILKIVPNVNEQGNKFGFTSFVSIDQFYNIEYDAHGKIKTDSIKDTFFEHASDTKTLDIKDSIKSGILTLKENYNTGIVLN
jgi:hypothetical protein